MVTLYLGGETLEASASTAVTIFILTPKSKIIGRFVGVTLEQTRPWKGTGVVVDTFCYLLPCWLKNIRISTLVTDERKQYFTFSTLGHIQRVNQ